MFDSSPRWKGAAVGALVVSSSIVIATAGCQRSASEPEPLSPRQVRELLLEELRPVTLKNCTLSRHGSRNDGGYLICANLIEDLGSAYSYGVGPNDDFACDLSRKHGVPVHQYDCFDPARPVCEGVRLSFTTNASARSGRPSNNVGSTRWRIRSRGMATPASGSSSRSTWRPRSGMRSRPLPTRS